MSGAIHSSWSHPRPTFPAKRAPTPSHFGAMLRRLREQRSWSVTELGRRIGGDHTSIVRLESGARNPSRGMVERLADALDASPMERLNLLWAADYTADEDGTVNVHMLIAIVEDGAVSDEAKETIHALIRTAIVVAQMGRQEVVW